MESIQIERLDSRYGKSRSWAREVPTELKSSVNGVEVEADYSKVYNPFKRRVERRKKDPSQLKKNRVPVPMAGIELGFVREAN